MKQQKIAFIGGGLVLAAFLIWLLFNFFGVQALFINTTVDEAVPTVVLLPLANRPPTTTEPNPKLPANHSGPLIVGDGVFQQGDSSYTISGKTTLTEEEGKRTLSLTDFSVTNGPDLFVYLVKVDTADNAAVKAAVANETFVNLGPLKGNRGNQMYAIPDDLDLAGEYVISIWCRRFSRNFGSALVLLRTN